MRKCGFQNQKFLGKAIRGQFVELVSNWGSCFRSIFSVLAHPSGAFTMPGFTENPQVVSPTRITWNIIAFFLTLPCPLRSGVRRWSMPCPEWCKLEMGTSHSQIRMQRQWLRWMAPADEQEGPVGEDQRVWFWRKPCRDHEDAWKWVCSASCAWPAGHVPGLSVMIQQLAACNEAIEELVSEERAALKSRMYTQCASKYYTCIILVMYVHILYTYQ